MYLIRLIEEPKIPHRLCQVMPRCCSRQILCLEGLYHNLNTHLTDFGHYQALHPPLVGLQILILLIKIICYQCIVLRHIIVITCPFLVVITKLYKSYSIYGIVTHCCHYLGFLSHMLRR